MTSSPFLWGAATSSHQVEGNNKASDWWAWEQAGKLKEPSGIACDQWNRFQEDFDLIQKLGHNAHRLSLEWSRFEPHENEWDEQAFLHYEEVLKALHKRNIEPIVTLHHFTNPQWFAERGGFEKEENLRYFSRYVKRVIKALGPYVRYWITINEPIVYVYHGYLTGLWPPGEQNSIKALKVIRHFILAHLEAYRIIHTHYESQLSSHVYVSLAKHLIAYEPCRPTRVMDRFAVFVRNFVVNDLILDAVQTGFLFFPGVFCELLPGQKALDFIGVNYYARDFIRFTGLGNLEELKGTCDKAHHAAQIRETNSLGWEIYPEGLYAVLKRLKRFSLPVMICENGVCTEDDLQRQRFIQGHLEQVIRAKQEGVNVWGYLYWSLLDNFEWAEGFGPRFGIVKMDYQNQTRKVKESAYVLSGFCRKLLTGD